VRLEELRAFMAELTHSMNLRDAGALVGLGHEALRKFIRGTTKRPHDRTVKAMALLYLERQKVVAAERDAHPTAGQLRLVLPRGLEPALETVSGLFDTLRDARRYNATAEALEQWLERRLREEYSAEPGWGSRPKRSRK
jgi:hypothetical protein